MDIPLTSNGENQIKKMASRIAAIGISLIVSSALIRTQRSALIISGLLADIPVVTEPLFNERRLGAWNGLPHEETEALIRAGETPPGGESEAQFRQRIISAAASLREKMAHKILVVSSSGVSRILSAAPGGGTSRRLANGELIQYSLTGVLASHELNGFAPLVPQSSRWT